ncbi:unnamed protein product [Arctogadus glacialis]
MKTEQHNNIDNRNLHAELSVHEPAPHRMVEHTVWPRPPAPPTPGTGSGHAPQPLLHPGQGQATPPSPSYTRDRVRPHPPAPPTPGTGSDHAPSPSYTRDIVHLASPTSSRPQRAHRAPPTASCVQVLSRVTFTM